MGYMGSYIKPVCFCNAMSCHEVTESDMRKSVYDFWNIFIEYDLIWDDIVESFQANIFVMWTSR